MRRSFLSCAAAAAGLVGITVPAWGAADPSRPSQWALDRIQIDRATASTGAGVTIAVVDTGIDLTHPDLKAKITSAYTCIGGTCSRGGDDDNGHGTHVAGIAAAATGNGVGIAGVARDAKLMAVKVLGEDGSGDCEDIAMGVRWAADHGARVINLSLGPEIGLLETLTGGSCVSALEDGAEYAWNKGVVVVIAAGNDSLRSVYSSPALEVVGATGPRDEPAYYSSSGADIYAPGGDAVAFCSNSACILSTWLDGGYRLEEGTSMAAPHVSGVAALLLARGYTHTQVLPRLQSTADEVGGILRLNAARAVGAAGGANTTPPSPKKSGSTPPKKSVAPAPSAPNATASAAPTPAPSGSDTPEATSTGSGVASALPQAVGRTPPSSSGGLGGIAVAGGAAAVASVLGLRLLHRRLRRRAPG